MADSPNKKQRLIKAVSVVVILACAISLYRSQCAGRPKPDMRPIVESGQMVAEETLKLLGNKGEVILVTMNTDYGKLQAKAFRREIEKHPQVVLGALEKVSADQLAKSEMGFALSSEYFSKVVDKYRKAAVIVLLVGPPLLSDQDIDRLDPKMPKIVVFSPMGLGVRKLLEDQVIQVAILPRVGSPMAPGIQAGSAEPQGAGRFYEAVTAETVRLRPVFEPPLVQVPKPK